MAAKASIEIALLVVTLVNRESRMHSCRLGLRVISQAPRASVISWYH